MVASRSTSMSTRSLHRSWGLTVALLGCLTVLTGATQCQAAAPPSPVPETVSASAPREIAPDVGAHATLATVAPPAVTPEVAPPSPAARLAAEQNVIDVFRAAAPATVFVTQKRLLRDWSMRALEVPAGSGTGFVWDTKGHIVTNYHVVDTGRARGTYSVTLYSQKTYDAELLGGDPNKDIAVLRLIDCDEPLIPIRVLPQTTALEVGQTAIAIGNPFGLDHTLTTGVVSAIGREVPGYGGVTIRDMIQTDASINPGNSGGPLLDSGAHLIGMNTTIFSKSGSSAGIGFAVPVAAVRRVVPQIIDKGRVAHPGIGIEPLPDAYAARVGVKGVVVTRTVPGGPAARAGIRGLSQDRTGEVLLGDVIVGIDEHKVRNYDDLYNAFDRYKVGDEVEIKLLRDGALATARIKLVDLP